MAGLSGANIFTSDSYDSSQSISTDPFERANTSLMPGAPSKGVASDPVGAAVNNTSLGSSQIPKEKVPDNSMSAEDVAQAKGAIKGVIATTKFMIDLNNASSAYRATSAEVRNNLMLSQLNEQDTIARGHQAMLERQNEGTNNSKQVMQHLSAQGIDVNSPGAQNIIKSYQAMGVYNAMREEANMYREAFKFDVEQSQYDYAQDMAKINYNAQKLNAGMNFAFGAIDAAATYKMGSGTTTTTGQAETFA